jgi:prolyl-tRNA synthetase
MEHAKRVCMLCCAVQATIRCFPFDQPAGPHTCFMTGNPAAEVALFAKSY